MKDALEKHLAGAAARRAAREARVDATRDGLKQAARKFYAIEATSQHLLPTRAAAARRKAWSLLHSAALAYADAVAGRANPPEEG